MPMHIATMVQSADQVRFALKPLKPGEGWYIIATHPSGQREHIAGFHDEREAEEWLSNSSGLRAWQKARGYVPDGFRAVAFTR